jgi:heme/copper-type cytochrome/quinol oxidase subunit 3
VTAIEPEAPELLPKNLAVGIRLWAAATTFFFFCPFFAYFYLRSLDSSGRWRPPPVDPPQGLGATVMVLVVLSSVALLLASRSASWPPLAAVSLVLGMLWLETLLASWLRSRDSLTIAGPRLDALAFYAVFLAGLGVVMWVVLYLT